MENETVTIISNLLAATIAGGVIGLERSYHGRPAGFRTHTLVCLASSILMLVAIYEKYWFSTDVIDSVKVDPTRMAQGIMTGIGFLGAGVIMREGLSVRGLTTAASIWITAAIGILAGVGFFSAVAIVTVLTLGILTSFRWIESKMPNLILAHNLMRFQRDNVMTELELRELITRHGFTIANLSYSVTEGGKYYEYCMMIRTRSAKNLQLLSQTLSSLDSLVEFEIAPTGD
jgi:putative Mg2+ transporter-C (MgtC) family protein